jgi:hypothetical protein
MAFAGAAGGLLLAGVVALVIYLATREDKPLGDGPPQQQPPPPTARALRLLVPAYFYPGGEGLKEWDRLINSSADAGVVAIVNPASGPGAQADPKYAQVIDRARAAKITLIGYVSTAYGKRPQAKVIDDVERWLRFYPKIRGIFFDEQASGADQVDYYTALHAQVRKLLPGALVVTNPGAVCAEAYLARSATDVACLAEGGKGFATYRPPSWTSRYAPHRFGVLIRGVSKVDEMIKYVRKMRGKHIGYFYVTLGTGRNPWDRLPSYWGEEVEAVRQVNKPPAP